MCFNKKKEYPSVVCISMIFVGTMPLNLFMIVFFPQKNNQISVGKI